MKNRAACIHFNRSSLQYSLHNNLCDKFSLLYEICVRACVGVSPSLSRSMSRTLHVHVDCMLTRLHACMREH